MHALANQISLLQTRHPLLLFLILGATLFALTWEDPESASADLSASPVILPAAQQELLQERFPDTPPEQLSAAQLHEALGDWLDHQVLVREGRRLGLGESDPIIERRIAQMMVTLLEDLHPLPEPDENQLLSWLKENQDRFGDPPRYTFEQVFLARGKHGDRAQEVAQELLQQLQEGTEDFRNLGNHFITGPVVREISAADLRKHFGKQFADTLTGLKGGNWQGPLRSGYGLHLVRITHVQPFRPWTLEEERDRILKDYQLRQKAVHHRTLRNQLIEKFGVRIQATAQEP